MKQKLLSIIFLVFTLTSCATYDPETNTYSDPLEGFNRTMFSFNYNVLDPYLLRPVAVFWKDYVPTPVRSGISNFSTNLSEPASMINNLLQGNVHQAGAHLARFFLNTVFGVGGLMDVASLVDPQLQRTDRSTFGTTLGAYDVPYGPYVVLPFYGGVTPREDLGAAVDYLYPPLYWLSFEMNVARWVFDGIESRAVAIEFEELLNSSNDPYDFMRHAYFQRHDFLASGGKIDTEKQQQREDSISDFLDDLDSEDW